jgi:hypothetical protein
VTMKRLSERLKVTPECAKGMAWGIGATITPVGTAMVVENAVADQLEREFETRPLPVRRDRQPAA